LRRAGDFVAQVISAEKSSIAYGHDGSRLAEYPSDHVDVVAIRCRVARCADSGAVHGAIRDV
jgi:hypothetical protein